MPLYYNPQPYDIYLSGPGGEKIRVRQRKTVSLPDYFDKYVAKGILTKMAGPNQPVQTPSARPTPRSRSAPMSRIRRPIRTVPVGRRVRGPYKADFLNVLESNTYPISNGIGVGILSYNRVHSLRRLISSIIQYTNLSRTTVFVSDDASTCPSLRAYLDQLPANIVVLKNDKQLGIAGNTNRLLRCLSRFQHKLLLNDDVEILAEGWDTVYFDVMQTTGLHHLCARQPGVYGAKRGKATTINGVALNVVDEMPHGAVLALDHKAFEAAGYFDQQYGIYGMEHVDWSARVHELKLQPPGYFDWADSSNYFRTHPEPSAIEERVTHLRKARELFTQRKPAVRIEADSTSEVPSITCIVPYRDIGRARSIRTVIENLQAQKFPNIEIVAIEEDASPKCLFEGPIKYKFIESKAAFNKSLAWNVGATIATHGNLLLQDADMLSPSDYANSVYNKLLLFEACHIGLKVFYLDKIDTDEVVESKRVRNDQNCNRCVDYYEGGSVGVRAEVYWRVGGFAEEFVGYGCEDCDFYARLAGGTVWLSERTVSFVHLDHPRTEGWTEDHRRNLAIEARLSSESVADRIATQRRSLVARGYQLREIP